MRARSICKSAFLEHVGRPVQHRNSSGRLYANCLDNFIMEQIKGQMHIIKKAIRSRCPIPASSFVAVAVDDSPIACRSRAEAFLIFGLSAYS